MPTSTDVPGRLPVAIDGHAYLADPNIVRQTVPVIRQQADTSSEAGEQSLNPQGLWRRSQESWHHGAGQAFLDGRQGDEPTDPHRFRSSKGVDVWTKGQVSLLRPTMNVWSSSATNVRFAVAQNPSLINPSPVLYISDGTEVYWAAIPYSLFNTWALQRGTGWTTTNATISAPGSKIRVTAVGAGTVAIASPAGTSGRPVEAGRAYGWAFNSAYVSGGAGKTPQLTLSWYNAAGTLLSQSGPFVGAGADTTGVNLTGNTTAPATAAFVSATPSWTAGWAAGEVHDVVFSIAPYDDVSTVGFSDTWTAVGVNGGQAAQTVNSITTDGSYVWAALGTSGLHRISPGGSATVDQPPAVGTGGIYLVGYANGFLLAAGSNTSGQQNTLWQINDPTGVPSLYPNATPGLKTHPNPNFVWAGISGGRSCVYAFGNSSSNGEVYKVPFDPNTGALSSAASPATYLPDGETIHALTFYAGVIIMGTGRGVRIGTADGAGNIDYGPLIPTVWPVRCLEPQDRYCWFGWTQYDTSNSGLGRIDLGFMTDRLTPAWASDLMTSDTSSGDVLDCVTFAPYGYQAAQRPPVRVFSVAGKGVYIEDPGSRVASGSFDTGTVRFSTSEPKTTRSVDLRHHALPAGGSVTVWMQRDVDPTGWEILTPSSTTAGSFGPAAPIDARSEQAEALEFRLILTRPTPSGTDFTRSPELTRWTAKVLPTPSTVDETLQIPLVMRTEVLTDTGDGVPYPVNVPVEIAYLKGLERTRQLITVQVGAETITNCFISASRFEPDTWGPGRQWLEGRYTVEISTARG